MSEEAKAAQEIAKAAQEVAKTTGQGIETVNKAGSFVARLVQPPLEEISGFITDKLKHAREVQLLKFERRLNEKSAQLGLPEPTRAVPLKITVPIMQEACMEEDGELQDRWANLLVNAANADSGIEVQSSYVHILRQLSALDVKNLDAIYSWPFDLTKTVGVLTHDLPAGSSVTGPTDGQGSPSDEVVVSLNNLARLRCIRLQATFGGEDLLNRAFPTKFGKAFIEACTMPKPAAAVP